MRMKILTAALTFMMLIGGILTVVNEGVESIEDESEVLSEENILNVDRTVRDPIRIDDDDDFASQAGEEGWTGDGTEENPYVIEGYEIDGTNHGYCIFIGNTTVHFELRDNNLHSADGKKLANYFKNSGIYLYNVENGVLTNNNISSNDLLGAHTHKSKDIIISNNIFTNNNYAIFNFDSSGNSITNNELSNNGEGIYLEDSDMNIISNNSLRSNRGNDIQISHSNGNTISNNTSPFESPATISIGGSKYNSFYDNVLNKGGISISGSDLEYWTTNDISTSNLANGKPVYFWKNRTSGNVPKDAGQIILANCTGVHVEGQHISGGHNGIIISFSDDNFITGNTISDSSCHGITFHHSSHNNISQNTVTDGRSTGITFYNSKENTFTENIVKDNAYDGLSFYHNSNKNMINNNTILSNNRYGVRIDGCTGNIIVHNNFIDNQVYTGEHAKSNGNNQWDKGYPLGGNYWSGHTEPDEYRGPEQEEPGSDGIVDDQYNIVFGYEVDKYPWTEPNGWNPEPSISLTRQTVGETWYGGSQENITWETTAGEGNIIGVDLEYSIDGGESWNKIATSIEDTGSYNWDVPYEVTVEACIMVTVHTDNGMEASDESGIFEIVKPTSTPRNLEATFDEEIITLNWDAPEDTGGSEIVEYKLYWGTESTDLNNEIVLDAGEGTSFNHKEVSEDQDYYYQVSAVNEAGESELSNEASYTVDGEENTPGFTLVLLTMSTIFALVIYRKRKFTGNGNENSLR